MPITNWGALQKSADDDETIEESIARLIAVHEGDSESHLGAGESLAAHKAADVIDHPEQSIVPDKFSNSEAFMPLIAYPPVSGMNDNCDMSPFPPLSGIYQDGSYTGEGSYSVGAIQPLDFGYDSGDVIFDFVVSLFGGSGTKQGEITFGFAKLQVKTGYYRVGYYSAGWTFSDWISVDATKFLRFRFHWRASDSTLYVYLRGTQVYSHSHSIDFESDFIDVIVLLDRGTSATATLPFGAFQVWLSGM